jgi:putative transposase
MRRMDIEALYQKANTSRCHAAHPVYPYLLRGLTIDTPNQVWAMDTTYSTPSQRSPPGRGPSCLSMSGMHLLVGVDVAVTSMPYLCYERK